MLETREVAERILAELEEAGEENVPTMLNTILPGTGDPSEVELLVGALESLVEADLVRMSTSYDAKGRLVDLSKEESLAQIAALSSNLSFGDADRLWDDSRYESGTPRDPPYPYIVITDAGMKAAREILMKRGHDWYQEKS
jgi:hypothetical protein